MKKSLVLALAVLCLIAFNAAAFAGPADVFADVPAKHWSYSAVQQLAKAGIISGDQGRFNGDKTVTRYEMAVMVANAMTKLDKADDSQKALIEKLAKEFNAELVKIGVRLSALEAAKPNIKIMGQARLTYAFRNDTSDADVKSRWNSIAPILNDQKSNYFTYRFRLEGLATLSPDLAFFARLRAQQYNVEGNNGTSGAGSFDQVKMEQFWVNWKKPFAVENTQLTVGRQGLFLGKGGVAMAVGDIDMVMADYANKGFTAKAILRNNTSTGAQDNKEVYTQIGAKISPAVNMTLFNMRGIQDYKINGYTRNLWSVGADAKLGDKVSFFGEYAKNNNAPIENKIYWFGFTNGNPMAHPDLGFQVPFTKKGASAQSLIYRYDGGHSGLFSNAVSPGDNQLHSVLGGENTAAGGVLWLAGTKGPEFYTEHILEKNVALIVKIGQAKEISTNKKVADYALFQLYCFF